ncbi:MAG: hypothetical protein EBU84_15445, partial [Actinobacteria bacterium]|nr:hypothetical protein [Actinomycetota bacterium]
KDAKNRPRSAPSKAALFMGGNTPKLSDDTKKEIIDFFMKQQGRRNQPDKLTMHTAGQSKNSISQAPDTLANQAFNEYETYWRANAKHNHPGRRFKQELHGFSDGQHSQTVRHDFWAEPTKDPNEKQAEWVIGNSNNTYQQPVSVIGSWVGAAQRYRIDPVDGRYLYSSVLNRDNLFKALNLLEDHRIESLMVMKYPQVRHHFIAAVLKHIIMGVQKAQYSNIPAEMKVKIQASLYLWLAGRRYLPTSVIAQARQEFLDVFKPSPEQMEELELLMDTYRYTPISRDRHRLAVMTGPIYLLLSRFIEICHYELGVPVFHNDPDTHNAGTTAGDYYDVDGHEGVGASQAPSDRQSAKSAEELKEWDKEQADKPEPKSADDTEASDNGDDTQESAPPSPSESDDADTDGEGAGASSGGDSGDDYADDEVAGDGEDGDSDYGDHDIGTEDDTASSNGYSGEPTPDGAERSRNPDTLIDRLRSLVAESSVNTMRHAKESLAAINKGVERVRQERLFSNAERPTEFREATTEWRLMSASLRNALRQLKANREDDWARGTSAGKVDIMRWVESRDLHTEIFDEWQEDGDERPDAEVVILIDRSGSMGRRFDTALMMGWAIKHACQAVDIPCSVFMYDTNYRLIYAPYARTGNGQAPMFPSGGNTEPKGLIQVVGSYLTKLSDAKHKILFSITDGEWGAPDDYRAPMAAMNQQGVQTLLLQLPTSIDV